MVEVKYQDEQFLVKGVIDLGYAGRYENKTFQSPDDGVIAIDVELDEILESLEDDDDDKEEFGLNWAYLKDYTKNTDGDSIAKAMETYLNEQEKKVADNIVLFNNKMVAQLLDQLVGVGLEFWDECPELFIKENVPKAVKRDVDDEDWEDDDYEFDIDELIYTYELGELEENIFELVDSAQDLTDVFSKAMPMFDIKKLFDGIVGTNLFLAGSCMSFQCDDSTENMAIFCGAYAEVRYDLTFFDWHNH